MVPLSGRSQPKPATMFAANTFDAVDAEVMPELSTAKATRNVMKWIPNALCVYSAAPAARGYFVTSSMYEHAVIIATANARMTGSQPAPPTCPATLPVRAYTPVPRMSPTMKSSSSFGPITRLRVSGCSDSAAPSAVVLSL